MEKVDPETLLKKRKKKKIPSPFELEDSDIPLHEHYVKDEEVREI